jgi:methanogenic corrinoid protein MtbC1
MGLHFWSKDKRDSANEEIAIEKDALYQAISAFRSKREVLAEEALKALTTDVLDTLAETAARHPAPPGIKIDESILEGLCSTILVPEPEPTIRFITKHLEAGLPQRDVYLGYICEAARWLGEQWDADLVSFYQVTSSTGHLYALIRSMRTRSKKPPLSVVKAKTALFATAPGEQHSLGVSLAAEVFTDAGWSVDLKVGAGHDDLINHYQNGEYDAVGLSYRTDERLPEVARLIVALRMWNPQVIIGVAPPTGTVSEQLLRLLDIDLVFSDLDTAVSDLERVAAFKHRSLWSNWPSKPETNTTSAGHTLSHE